VPTRVEAAEKATMTKPELSRLERAADLRLSTIRRYVIAMGGDVEIFAVMKGKKIALRGVLTRSFRARRSFSAALNDRLVRFGVVSTAESLAPSACSRRSASGRISRAGTWDVLGRSRVHSLPIGTYVSRGRCLTRH
jgi:hypothetical protein